MPHAPISSGDRQNTFQRYRRKQHRRGMKLLRMWLPDPHRPEFIAEARRQGRLLRRAAEEADALAFIDSAFAWPDR